MHAAVRREGDAENEPVNPHTDDRTQTNDSAVSKRREKKSLKITKKFKPVPGSVDVRVQHTNDDSVVSKRSAVFMGYAKDEFLRHFVAKPTRRAPLINRGYYLRMLVMTDLVTRAINHFFAACHDSSSDSIGASTPIQVLSLGAGYDTLAFRTLLSNAAPDHHRGTVVSHAVCETLTPAAISGGQLHFFDVDFPEVMQAKAGLMAAAPPGTFALANVIIEPTNAVLPVRSDAYHAVGVDLREAQERLLPSLAATAATTHFSPDNPTVIYAECVMQYMPPAAARELVAYVARTFTDAIFIAYDQLCPADSFGRVMVNSLKQKSSPLLGIDACPDGPSLVERARQAGMADAFFADFYKLSRYHMGPLAEEARLRGLEEFDELEEWAEMCEHYGVTLAFTNRRTSESANAFAAASAEEQSATVLGHPAFTRCEYARRASSTAATGVGNSDVKDGNTFDKVKAAPLCVMSYDSVVRQWPSSRFGFEGWGCGDVFAEPHPTDPDELLIVSFGGFCLEGKTSRRVNTVRVHAMREGELCVVMATPHPERRCPHEDTGDGGAIPDALVFHSFSRLRALTYVVFGGRTNPSTASARAHLLRLEPQPAIGGVTTMLAQWTPLAAHASCSPEAALGEAAVTSVEASGRQPRARYRHSAAGLPENRIFVVGGCCVSAPGEHAPCPGDAWIGSIDVAAAAIRWARVTFDGENEHAFERHSAALTPLDDVGARFLLSGGLRSDGQCCTDVLLLDLEARTCRAVSDRPGAAALARFSHTVTRLPDSAPNSLLIFGGCASDVKASQTFSTVMLVNVELDLPAVEIRVPNSCPPSLARHAVVPVGNDCLAVIGGGYTCFSFGAFTSRPFLLQVFGDKGKKLPWDGTTTASGGDAETVAPPSSTAADVRSRLYPCNSASTASSVWLRHLLSLPRRSVPERPYSAEAFLEAARAACGPVVFRRVPLGPCVERWADPAYLQQAERDAVVSVHVGNSRGGHALDFVRKNFTFRHVPFHALVSHIEESVAYHKLHGKPPVDRETWYFRSVAASMKTDRANLWTDFPHLGADFVLPLGAREHVMPRLHQACLRLNAAPLQLWTHYDTYDNILCQVVGRKRVVLFPPSEYGNLYMSGSSSPVLHIDAPNVRQYPRFIDACKRATEVILLPGDVLYFPANWFHHITTLMDEPADTYSVSVNLFFEHFSPDVYDKRDLYGNKDIPAVVDLREEIVARVRECVARQKLTRASESAPLPASYAHFALRQALQDLEKLAEEMNPKPGL